MAIKNADAVRTSIITAIQAVQPRLTTRIGSVVRDIFINPSSQELGYLYSELNDTIAAQSVLTALGEDLVKLAQNFDIYRIGSAKAYGAVTFFTSSIPVVDIIIPSGTYVTTIPDDKNQVYRFITLQTVVMLAASATSYYNPLTGDYEITAMVEAETGGVSYNVAAYSVSILPNAVSGVMGVFNSSEITGGTGEESLVSLSTRILNKLRGINIGTQNGYYENTFNVTGVLDVKIVGPRDPYMTRKSAGAIDVYVKGLLTTPVFESHVVSSTVPPDILVNKRPVITTQPGVLTSTLLGTFTYGVDWEWLSDNTSVFQGSIKALDYIHWLIIPASPVGTLTISYLYNSLIENTQSYLDGQGQHCVTVDTLVKWVTPVVINITCTIKVASGYNSTVVIAAVQSAVSSLLSGYLLGQEVQSSDILATINNVNGVDDVRNPLDSITDAAGILIVDSNDNMVIPVYKYATAGIITVNLF